MVLSELEINDFFVGDHICIFHIGLLTLRELREHAHLKRASLLPSLALGRKRGGRVDLVISDVVAGHTLVDIYVADPTRRDLVECTAKHNFVAATDAER